MKKLGVALCILFLPTTLYGQSFSRADLRPFIRVNGERMYTDILGNKRIEDFDYAITQGGALSSAEVIFGDSDFISLFLRGVGEPAKLNILKISLTQNRVGLQRSCEIVTEASQIQPYKITWYGKGERRNSFTVSFGPAGASGSPLCPAGIETIVGAIQDYVQHVYTKPGTEVLRSR